MAALRLLAPTLLLAACSAPRPVHLSSEPPGARVVIDQVDSGFVTPCMLDLPNAPARRIDLVLPGYQTATRFVRFEHRGELVYWRDATIYYNTWSFPLWLNSEDLFIFWKSRAGESPSRIFVRLRREADR